MTRTARRLAWGIFAASGAYILITPPGTSWPKAVVAAAIGLAAWALLTDELPKSDDEMFARIVHPSAWGCDADDWPMESDGIPAEGER